MFKIADKPAYWWPVTFTLPSETQPGARDEHGFEVRFSRLDEAEHAELVTKIFGKDDLTSIAVCQQVVCDFRGVVDASDVEIQFTDESLLQLLNVPGVATAVMRAYFASREDAPEKNSSRPPEPGSSAAPK